VISATAALGTVGVDGGDKLLVPSATEDGDAFGFGAFVGLWRRDRDNFDSVDPDLDVGAEHIAHLRRRRKQ